MATLHLAVNGRSYTIDVDSQTSLLTVLREQLDLTQALNREHENS
jgi:aerobic-type carbon monoxide dehydrogenase small subunit (CoxS/CutS family)